MKYREGFIKNRYIGRTFIMPGQERAGEIGAPQAQRDRLEFRNKVVLLVDDSIVRGTTSQADHRDGREAGARKVYLASAAPPVRYPNVYGIDMPSARNWSRTVAATTRSSLLGCDWLIYQDLADLESPRCRRQRRAHPVRHVVLHRRVRHRHRTGLFRACEEVAHVAAGSHWFRWCCEREGVDPRITFDALLREHARSVLRPPFNLPARRAAGFDPDELDALQALAGVA
jgi:hypothetical protein